MANLAEMSDSEDEEEDEQMEELQDSDDESVEALPVASGFSWTGESAPVAEEQESEADQESESEDTPKKKKNKKSKDIVQDKTGDLSTQAPQVAADYERLLLGSPNSSYLWINYMAFQLQLSEVDKAREIGERALTKISFREEQEKLNVWVAMMNLENTFGTADSLEAVFKRAVIVCEPKKVYLQLVKIYERSNKFDVRILRRVIVCEFHLFLTLFLSVYTESRRALEYHCQKVQPVFQSLDIVWHVLLTARQRWRSSPAFAAKFAIPT